MNFHSDKSHVTDAASRARLSQAAPEACHATGANRRVHLADGICPATRKLGRFTLKLLLAMVCVAALSTLVNSSAVPSAAQTQTVWSRSQNHSSTDAASIIAPCPLPQEANVARVMQHPAQPPIAGQQHRTSTSANANTVVTASYQASDNTEFRIRQTSYSTSSPDNVGPIGGHAISNGASHGQRPPGTAIAFGHSSDDTQLTNGNFHQTAHTAGHSDFGATATTTSTTDSNVTTATETISPVHVYPSHIADDAAAATNGEIESGAPEASFIPPVYGELQPDQHIDHIQSLAEHAAESKPSQTVMASSVGHSFQISTDNESAKETQPDSTDSNLFLPPPITGYELLQEEDGSVEESTFTTANDDLLWWEQDLTRPVLRDRQPLPMTLERALGLAITEAPELQILHSDWYIRQTEVDRLSAAFDWTTFVDTIWNRDSTPVGSTLDGAARRLRNRTLSAQAGFRRLTQSGAELQLSQSFGTRNSNSQFINPNNQGTSRLAIELEQPLLRGAGEHYNTSRIRIAELSKDGAFDRFQIGIQDHLLEVASAYWALVLRRGRFVQAVNSWQRSSEIAEEMASRREIDVTPSMLERAQSEVAVRLSTAIEAEHDIIRAQDALLRLIYGSRFTDFAEGEVLTQTLPMRQSEEIEPSSQIEKAIHNRSEVHQAIREIKAAAVQFDVAANEILPALNMVLTGYVAGLRGNNDLGGSFLNQFTEGEPGVGIGFNFEVPYRNRAAQAATEQAHIAIKRMQAQLEQTIGVVTEDVRGQVIQRNKFGEILTQQREALERADRILSYARTRREQLVDGTNVADLYLENLLQMQDRLASAEFLYLQSQVRYSLADNALLRAISAIDTIAKTESLADNAVSENLPQLNPEDTLPNNPAIASEVTTNALPAVTAPITPVPTTEIPAQPTLQLPLPGHSFGNADTQ